jgi:hypothetical protein
MLRRICCLTILTFTSVGCVSQVPKKEKAILPADCQLTLDDASIIFTQLELNDGCVITFSPTVQNAEIVIETLTLHGQSTIDLSPRESIAGVPGKPPTPPQALNNPPTQTGQNGSAGVNGQPGFPGTNLHLTVETLVAVDGSLWIKTDGGPGSPGGPGGDGAKGAGPLTSGTHCYDGGAGGNGGPGGTGGQGGSTAKVLITVGPKTIAANQTPGVAPSARPTSATIPGAVVAAGSAGPGGAGGSPGGSGGPGGEGRSCHFPATDAHPGPNGLNGPNGSPGSQGIFVP